MAPPNPLRRRPGPRRRPDGLSHEIVVKGALRLVDRDGLDALTMRRLGAELEVEAMSLYHWFPNKAAIIAELAGAVHGEVVLPPRPRRADGSAKYLADVGRAVRRGFLQHPAALPVLAAHPMDVPEEAVAVLVEAGLRSAAAHSALDAVLAYATGATLVEVGRGENGTREADKRFDAGLQALIAGLLSGPRRKG